MPSASREPTADEIAKREEQLKVLNAPRGKNEKLSDEQKARNAEIKRFAYNKRFLKTESKRLAELQKSVNKFRQQLATAGRGSKVEVTVGKEKITVDSAVLKATERELKKRLKNLPLFATYGNKRSGPTPTPASAAGSWVMYFFEDGTPLHKFFNDVAKDDPKAFGEHKGKAVIDSLPNLRQGYAQKQTIANLLFKYVENKKLSEPGRGVHADKHMLAAFGNPDVPSYFVRVPGGKDLNPGKVTTFETLSKYFKSSSDKVNGKSPKVFVDYKADKNGRATDVHFSQPVFQALIPLNVLSVTELQSDDARKAELATLTKNKDKIVAESVLFENYRAGK